MATRPSSLSHARLPEKGAVLGIDVGWSEKRKTSAACLLVWDDRYAGWEIRRFTAKKEDRRAVLSALLGRRKLAMAAIDGPLPPDFSPLHHHREAERALTLGIGREVGKPGAVNTPVGRKLCLAATTLAKELAARRCLARTHLPYRVTPHAVIEAFPSAFLGVMLPTPFASTRARRSDDYFVALAGTEAHGLLALLHRLLEGRQILGDVIRIKNHDERAAFVCALTALAAASGHYTAVGDRDGYLYLPPPANSEERAGLQPWAEKRLWTALRYPGRKKVN